MVRFWVTLFLHALIKEELRDIDKNYHFQAFNLFRAVGVDLNSL